MINGAAHGPMKGTATCQLHMRSFKDGDTIFVEPWRAKAFPVIKDLIVDRGALDRIIQAGGFITASTGGAQDANAMLIPKASADAAMDAAACIGCGACVAACPNASASLFTAAKISHLGLLAAGSAGAIPPRAVDGRADGAREIRRLHALWGVPGSVSEGNQHRHDNANESRFHQSRRARDPPVGVA